MQPFHPSQSRRLYRAISAAAAAHARARFAAHRANVAAHFHPIGSPEQKRFAAALAACAQAHNSADIARQLAERADWTTGESADIDTRAAEDAANQARRHAARAVSLAARCQAAQAWMDQAR